MTWTCSSSGPNCAAKGRTLPEAVWRTSWSLEATAAPQRLQLKVETAAGGCSRRHTSTEVIWFICALISWILLRIFFWWPASVTPTLRMSLETEDKVFSR